MQFKASHNRRWQGCRTTLVAVGRFVLAHSVWAAGYPSTYNLLQNAIEAYSTICIEIQRSNMCSIIIVKFAQSFVSDEGRYVRASLVSPGRVRLFHEKAGHPVNMSLRVHNALANAVCASYI